MRKRLIEEFEDNNKENKSSDWVFCNTELEPYPDPWSSDYKCPKCGNMLVNAVGLCSTKIFSNESKGKNISE